MSGWKALISYGVAIYYHTQLYQHQLRPLFFEYLFYKPADHSWNLPLGNKIIIIFPVANLVFSPSNCLFRHPKYTILMKANAYWMLKRNMFEALFIQCTPPPNITLKTFMINLKIKRCGSLTLRVFPQ